MRTDQAPNQIRKTAAAVAAGGSVGDISVYAKSTTLLLLTLAIFLLPLPSITLAAWRKKIFFFANRSKKCPLVHECTYFTLVLFARLAGLLLPLSQHMFFGFFCFHPADFPLFLPLFLFVFSFSVSPVTQLLGKEC